MKKLLCALILFCSCLTSLPAYATYWVHLFNFGDAARVSIDADTLHYDEQQGCMRFWEKTEYTETGSINLRDVYLNLENSTYATNELIVFDKYEDIYIQRWDELYFIDTISGSPEDYTRLAVQYINSLTPRGVYWLYNQEPIPEPSPLGSAAWEFDPPNYEIDRGTAYSDEWKETYWGLDGTEMEYVYLDKQTNRRAVLAYYHVEDGQLMYGYTFPIIIWSKPGGTMTQAEQDCLQEQRALMHTFHAADVDFFFGHKESDG